MFYDWYNLVGVLNSLNDPSANSSVIFEGFLIIKKPLASIIENITLWKYCYGSNWSICSGWRNLEIMLTQFNLQLPTGTELGNDPNSI